MRLAYEINYHNTQKAMLDIAVFNATEINEPRPKIATVIIQWQKQEDDIWGLPSFRIYDFTDDHYSILRKLKKAIKEDAKSPVAIIRAMHAEIGAAQVVWDTRLAKYRNVTTMKAGETSWAAVGLKAISVSAPDAETAKIRMQKVVTEGMIANPGSAVELSAWFAQGMKVEQAEDGKLPDVINREDLANPGEEDLAKSPVIVKPKAIYKKKDAPTKVKKGK